MQGRATCEFNGRAGHTSMQYKRFEYYVIRYVPDATLEMGIDIAVVAVSDSQPGRVALKRIPSLTKVLELDSDADVDLLNAFLDELSENVRLASRDMERALQSENCIRVLPSKEFVTSDFEGTVSLLSDAELGIE